MLKDHAREVVDDIMYDLWGEEDERDEETREQWTQRILRAARGRAPTSVDRAVDERFDAIRARLAAAQSDRGVFEFLGAAPDDVQWLLEQVGYKETIIDNLHDAIDKLNRRLEGTQS